jgi:hypothetical protein
MTPNFFKQPKEPDPLDSFAEPLTPEERIASLENQLEVLRDAIRSLQELSDNFSLPILGVEVAIALSNWADPDESEEV